jgi:integrase
MKPTTSDYRDRALLLLGFAGALRRSELVALDVEDLRFCKEGLRLTIRQSKTDQQGQGQDVAIPFGSRPETCPVEAVKRWIAHSRIVNGALFRRLDSGGHTGAARLDGASVGHILKRRAKAVGLDPNSFSGHSLRSGLLTSSAVAGASIFKMQAQSRHKSLSALNRYVRDARIFDQNVVKGLL